MPRRKRRYAPRSNAAPRALRVRIAACADLECFSLELQKMIARLEDRGVHAIASCSLYLDLRDASGNRMALHDDERSPIHILDI